MAMTGSDAFMSSSEFSKDSDSSNEDEPSDEVGFLTPIPEMDPQEWENDRQYHESLVSNSASAGDRQSNRDQEELETTPLFSASVLACVKGPQPKISFPKDVLPSFSFLAKVLDTFGGHEQRDTDDLQTSDLDESGAAVRSDGQPSQTETPDSRLFVNMNAPWSAFICGSQGSGKSHTLSCMLEAALKPSQLGPLKDPLAGMVFHYDKFTGLTTSQPCEAVYLSSPNIRVTVLVSPSSFYRMKKVYESLPEGVTKPVVAPLLLEEKHLNIAHMMKLMAVDEKDGKVSLYMESVRKILKSLAMKDEEDAGLNYYDFKEELKLEKFNEAQRAMLNIRLQLLESFMFPRDGVTWLNPDDEEQKIKMAKPGIWTFEAGSLTIVDLSCPFVDESAACAMFDICLAVFLENRQTASRIVALDEAHKFMTGTDSSSVFTESLLSVIREQRHLATRVIIATQEPTISPSLLDLSSMTIVHRFTSPAWHESLRSHLAAMSSIGEATKEDVQDNFKQIVKLDTGEAFIFSPSAMLGTDNQGGNGSPRMVKMGSQYIKVRMRKRTTADGGKSILATSRV